ncbi:UNVERIFIED_CONTAM: hypothetical protein Scaly_2209700 [Sesamum calycinum]|uniref:Reverse transcriptase domain-containing protein n=1 Tax=Sesamum calycinum TaxID=2727403 RepID=A0AAW2MP48_9LAMI
MMDASQGYRQIMLAPKDRKRVSFITSDGTFCYIAMSSSLKNTGATFQRLVNKILRPQLGRNVEFFIDDIHFKAIGEMSDALIQGSEACIVITSPQEEDTEFAIKFEFKASNNETEYEALVVGMRMAHEVGARTLS